jgi:hypothetical protein
MAPEKSPIIVLDCDETPSVPWEDVPPGMRRPDLIERVERLQAYVEPVQRYVLECADQSTSDISLSFRNLRVRVLDKDAGDKPSGCDGIAYGTAQVDMSELALADGTKVAPRGVGVGIDIMPEGDPRYIALSGGFPVGGAWEVGFMKIELVSFDGGEDQMSIVFSRDSTDGGVGMGLAMSCPGRPGLVGDAGPLGKD